MLRVVDRSGHWLGLMAVCWLWAASGAARAEVIDLADAFPAATIHMETRSIDFGTPSARPFLLAGFHSDEVTPRQTLVWSQGDRSSIGLILADRRPRRLHIHCWPLAYPHAPPQVVKFSLNGVTLVTRQLKRRVQTIQIELPVGPQRVGMNRLEVRYSDVQQPARVVPNSTDGRKLALAWDWVRVSAAGNSGQTTRQIPAPTVDVEDGRDRIVVPPGSLVAYYVWLRPGASLKISSLQSLDAAGEPTAATPRLGLRVETDEDGKLLEAKLHDAEEGLRVEMPVPEDRIARIAISVGTGPESSAVAIQGARFEIPDPKPRRARSEMRGQMAGERNDTPRDELRSPRANVVLYVIDALRADLLGAYGNELPVSPHFDRIANEGVLFENAKAASSWTRPTVVSILTGLRPTRHGVIGRMDRLAPQANTLAEILQHAGYRTGGFITNANVAAEFGVAQGFDTYEWYPYGKDLPDVGPRSAVEASRSALEWIARPGEDAPFFAYLHISDPHGPYMPPRLERARFAADVGDREIGTRPYMRELAELSIPVTDAVRRDLTSLYLGEIAYTDARLGELLASLDELGHRENTLVIVVADHGEEIFDHGWSEHGKTLYAEQIHVQQVDLMPTILDLLGLDAAAATDGRSLLPLLAKQDEDPSVTTFAYLAIDGRRVRSVTEGNLKLIETFEYAHPKDHHPGLQLFDLAEDPGEQVNLAAERPVAAGYLRSKARAELHRARTGLEPDTAVLGDAVEEELRALGYLE
jgi:arylsulfatase A-like enzyme